MKKIETDCTIGVLDIGEKKLILDQTKNCGFDLRFYNRSGDAMSGIVVNSIKELRSVYELLKIVFG